MDLKQKLITALGVLLALTIGLPLALTLAAAFGWLA
jgi:hypothetical protein